MDDPVNLTVEELTEMLKPPFIFWGKLYYPNTFIEIGRHLRVGRFFADIMWRWHVVVSVGFEREGVLELRRKRNERSNQRVQD